MDSRALRAEPVSLLYEQGLVRHVGALRRLFAELVESLYGVGSGVIEIARMNGQIASAAEEQTTVSEMINKNVHQIVVIAQETSSDTSESAAISKELMHLSDQLNAEVCRYKI